MQALGVKPRLAVAGALLLLWLPRLTDGSTQRSSVPAKPSLRVELRLLISGFELRVVNESEVLTQGINVDVASWQVGSPGVEFSKSYPVRDLGPWADFVIHDVFGTPPGGSRESPGLFWREAHGPISGYFSVSCNTCPRPRGWAFYVPPRGQINPEESELSKGMEARYGGESSPWPLAEFLYPDDKPGIGRCVNFPIGACYPKYRPVWHPHASESRQVKDDGQLVRRPDSKLWLRTTDTSGVKFEVKSQSVIIPSGRVLGVVSDPRARVFLLYRIARECFSPEETHGSQRRWPNCSDPPVDWWHTSEATVDAAGNWSGQICPFGRTFPSGVPDFDYTEIMAIAAHDGSAVAGQIVQLTCGLSEDTLSKDPSLTCSESVVVLRAKPLGYAIWKDYEPKPRPHCFSATLLQSKGE